MKNKLLAILACTSLCINVSLAVAMNGNPPLSPDAHVRAALQEPLSSEGLAVLDGALEVMQVDYFGRPTRLELNGELMRVEYEGAAITAVSSIGARVSLSTNYEQSSQLLHSIVGTNDAGELVFEWISRDDPVMSLLWTPAAVWQAAARDSVSNTNGGTLEAGPALPPVNEALAAIAAARVRSAERSKALSCDVAGVRACGDTYIAQGQRCGDRFVQDRKDCQTQFQIGLQTCSQTLSAERQECDDWANDKLGLILVNQGIATALQSFLCAYASVALGGAAKWCFPAAAASTAALSQMARSLVATIKADCRAKAQQNYSSCSTANLQRSKECLSDADQVWKACRCAAQATWVDCVHGACPTSGLSLSPSCRAP